MPYNLSDINAKKKSENNGQERDNEYYAILQVFMKWLDSTPNDMEQWEVLSGLMELRAEFAIRHAIRGFGMGYDEAIELVRNYSDLSYEEKSKRDVLVAAIDNLIDFAVVEEYQMACECSDSEGDELKINSDRDDLADIFNKYNYRYSYIENQDIEYAMIIAAGIVLLPDNTILTFMTQGDERVRPWHLQYEGFSAPKSNFPAWLVPPIENMCRCRLDTDNISAQLSNILCSENKLTQPEWFNPVFSESVAFGGRIFSEAHPYFQVNLAHKDKLRIISSQIKEKYFNA